MKKKLKTKPQKKYYQLDYQLIINTTNININFMSSCNISPFG